MMEAAKGCDTTIHSAAYVKVWGELSHAREITVTGTRNVMKVSSMTETIERVVHVGTEAGCIPYDGSPLHNLTESTPLPDKPFPGIYSTTKNEAEKAALAFQGLNNLDVVVVRPRLIWGRDDTVLLPSIVEAAKSGVLQWFDGGEYYTSTCHVENVVEGIVRASVASASIVAGRPFFLTDGKYVAARVFVFPSHRFSNTVLPFPSPSIKTHTGPFNSSGLSRNFFELLMWNLPPMETIFP